MLKIIFAGTPEFAIPTLKKLVASSHEVVAVYTQPDRPAGRGQQLQASPVKKMAEVQKIRVLQPKTLRDEMVQNDMRAFNADVMVVVAYGLILPEAVLQIPRLGCVNVHPSLLPKWRGAAPIARSIEAGDSETGMTIMQLDKGMDSGPILRQEKHKMIGDESSETLYDLFSVRSAELLLETVNALEENKITPVKQNDIDATYAAKIDKKEAIINWNESAIAIHNKIRALYSWPVAHTIFSNDVLRIWEASVITEKTHFAPGTVVRAEKNALWIATGNGVLQIRSVQLPGKKRILIADFMHAHMAQLIPGKTKLG